MSQTPKNSIRTFALVCVAITSAFVIGAIVWYTLLLSGRDWCATAIGAAKSADSQRPEFAVSGCFSLLNKQVDALSLTLHIFAFVIALCLAVLMVIVVAGGKVSWKADKTGIEGNISAAEPATQAANRVATAAVDEAKQVIQETKP